MNFFKQLGLSGGFVDGTKGKVYIPSSMFMTDLDQLLGQTPTQTLHWYAAFIELLQVGGLAQMDGLPLTNLSFSVVPAGSELSKQSSVASKIKKAYSSMDVSEIPALGFRTGGSSAASVPEEKPAEKPLGSMLIGNPPASPFVKKPKPTPVVEDWIMNQVCLTNILERFPVAIGLLFESVAVGRCRIRNTPWLIH